MQLMTKVSLVAIIIIALQSLTGCGGTKSFPLTARAGDTIALAVGWKHEFSRDQITITFEPESGAPVVYTPDHVDVQASVNLYPDPASYMAVGLEAGLGGELYNYGSTYGAVLSSLYTKNDPDWWQTTLFVNLPSNLPVGITNITIASSGEAGEVYGPTPVEIISGTGQKNPLAAQGLETGLSTPQKHTLERAPHYVVDFSSDAVPYGIQVDFSHDPDVGNGGAGRAYIVNPRGDIKSVNWKDDGENLRVLLLPSKDKKLNRMIKFKFYVSGGVTGLALSNLKAFDINGNNVSGVTAEIQ